MQIPKIAFITNDRQKEANYVCFNAKSIEQGFYQKAGMYALPYAFAHKKTVFFPDLNYSHGFWKTLANNKQLDYSKPYPPKCLDEILKALPPSKPEQQIVRTQKIKDWGNIQKKFFELCDSFLLLGETLSKISEINILLTEYGTRGSFYPLKSGKKIVLNMTARDDFSPGDIGHTILLAFYKIKTGKSGETGDTEWVKRTATVNFVITQTCFSKILITKPSSLGNQTAKVISDSQKYLAKLGFTSKSIISLNKGKIEINQKPINGLFTKQEINFLKALLDNQTLTYDEAAEAIWKDKADDKYSLYALAKLAENTRSKLRSQGVNKKVILTIRNVGYVLDN